ncbi:MAG TPA: hypothetical protein VFR98_12070 [Agromyces sp.]|nr:hypothetical protein [Agromyces sp.]
MAAEADGVRAAFAASPRAAAALDDAAREAALRLEAGRASTASDADSAGFASVAGFAVDRVVRGALAALVFAALVFAAVVLAALVLDVLVLDAPVFDAPVFDAPVFDALVFGAGCFAAADSSADDFDVADLEDDDAADVAFEAELPDAARGDRARAGRGVDERAGSGAAISPRSADTPVPVPPGVSSSGPDRETEVTPTTYQPARSARWRTPPSARRGGILRSCRPERKLGIASRSGYGFRLDSASADRLRYPVSRHNGVSRSELADELPANSL